MLMERSYRLDDLDSVELPAISLPRSALERGKAEEAGVAAEPLPRGCSSTKRL